MVGCGATTASVEYSVNAQQNYERGKAELDRQDWAAASSHFSFVIRMFPYSKWEPLAELGLADIQMGQGNYVEAITAYRQFNKDHPFYDQTSNGQVSYRIGEAYGRSQCGRKL